VFWEDDDVRTSVLALAFAPVLGLACGGHGTPDTMLVSTSWLAAHLKDANLVVLAVGEKADYDGAHIPGARYMEYKEIAPKGANGLSAELPPMATLAAVFSNLGVGNDSRVVIYRIKDNALTQAARVYVTLDAMGLGANASLLDGNLPTWTDEGHAATAEVVSPKPGKLEPCAQNDVITDLAFVRNNLHQDGVRILDARSPEYYSGATPRPGFKPGHIEGAGNVFWNSAFTENGKLKPPSELRAQFSAAGVKAGDKVVTYCFIGQQASALYFISRYLGYDTRLYDGSWEEWSKDPALPVAMSH
jgi:thiosulfate/3-mercaptopyruvate sulfurtransferase